MSNSGKPPKGVIPKGCIPWKPGQSGNPAGRPCAGRYVLDWIAKYRNASEAVLRRDAKNVKLKFAQRAAANRMLRMLELPDMADFESILDGKQSIVEARKAGVPTTLIKKTKTKTRAIPQEGKEPIVEVDRELELHDRSGEEFDRLLDRTQSKPKTDIEHTGLPPSITFTFD